MKILLWTAIFLVSSFGAALIAPSLLKEKSKATKFDLVAARIQAFVMVFFVVIFVFIFLSKCKVSSGNGYDDNDGFDYAPMGRGSK